MKKKYFYILSFVLIVIIGMIIEYFQSSAEEIAQKAYAELKFEHYNGKVTEKCLDSKNHNYPKAVLENEFGKHDIYFVRDQSGLFEYLVVGDSIRKEYGKYEVVLKRKDRHKVFVLDYWLRD